VPNLLSLELSLSS